MHSNPLLSPIGQQIYILEHFVPQVCRTLDQTRDAKSEDVQAKRAALRTWLILYLNQLAADLLAHPELVPDDSCLPVLAHHFPAAASMAGWRAA